jgi:hypothetical protein
MRLRTNLFGALLCLSAMARLPAEDKLPVDGFEWREDLDAARAEALRSGKPLLVIFRCLP